MLDDSFFKPPTELRHSTSQGVLLWWRQFDLLRVWTREDQDGVFVLRAEGLNPEAFYFEEKKTERLASSEQLSRRDRAEAWTQSLPTDAWSRRVPRTFPAPQETSGFVFVPDMHPIVRGNCRPLRFPRHSPQFSIRTECGRLDYARGSEFSQGIYILLFSLMLGTNSEVVHQRP